MKKNLRPLRIRAVRTGLAKWGHRIANDEDEGFSRDHFLMNPQKVHLRRFEEQP